jgi:hypothetical protein
MSDQYETLEMLRQQLQEKFDGVESFGIEPLIDDPLEHAFGSVEESFPICSWFWCSYANNDQQENTAAQLAHA